MLKDYKKLAESSVEVGIINEIVNIKTAQNN